MAGTKLAVPQFPDFLGKEGGSRINIARHNITTTGTS
jgi:hypothetical protein